MILRWNSVNSNYKSVCLFVYVSFFPTQQIFSPKRSVIFFSCIWVLSNIVIFDLFKRLATSQQWTKFCCSSHSYCTKRLHSLIIFWFLWQHWATQQRNQMCVAITWYTSEIRFVYRYQIPESNSIFPHCEKLTMIGSKKSYPPIPHKTQELKVKIRMSGNCI